MIETPPDRLLEIAEKIRLKLPIEENNLGGKNFSETFWHRFKFLVPDEIKPERKRKYFTASYDSDQQEK